MFFGHGAAEKDDGGWKAHVHAERDDEGRHKGLGPVGLVNGHGGGENRGDAESDQGEDHDIWNRHFGDEEASHHRGDETGDGGWRVLCRSHEWRVVPELLQELPHVVQPDPEAGPAGCCCRENEEHRGGKCLDRQQRLRNSAFHKDEDDQRQDAQDQENVDVWIWPTHSRALVPSDVDEHKATDPRDSTQVVEPLLYLHPLLHQRVRAIRFGNGPDRGGRHDEADNPHDPVSPSPCCKLRKQGRKCGAEDVSSRRAGTEQAEDDVLSHSVGVRRPQQGQPVGCQKRRTHPLEAAGYGEEDVVGIITCAAEYRPHPVPCESSHENTLVAIHVAQTPGDQDESASSQAEGGDIPAQFAGILYVEVVANYMERCQSLPNTGLR